MDSWDEQIDEEHERQVAALKKQLREIGSSAPDRRVWHAVRRNYALLATHVLTQRVWLSVAEPWVRGGPEEWWPFIDFERFPDPPEDPDEAYRLPAYAMRRVLDAGADPEDLKEVVRHAVEDVLYDVMNLLNHGHNWERTDLPGWRLMEVDTSGELTGRKLGDLVNGFNDAYPWRVRGPTEQDDDGSGAGEHQDRLTTEPDEAESA